jgi:hypothetical protein
LEQRPLVENPTSRLLRKFDPHKSRFGGMLIARLASGHSRFHPKKSRKRFGSDGCSRINSSPVKWFPD